MFLIWWGQGTTKNKILELEFGIAYLQGQASMHNLTCVAYLLISILGFFLYFIYLLFINIKSSTELFVAKATYAKKV